MPLGVIINSAAVLLGGLLGSFLGKHVSKRICKSLLPVFGICSMAMGIAYIVKAQTLPAVVLAIIPVT